MTTCIHYSFFYVLAGGAHVPLAQSAVSLPALLYHPPLSTLLMLTPRTAPAPFPYFLRPLRDREIRADQGLQRSTSTILPDLVYKTKHRQMPAQMTETPKQTDLKTACARAHTPHTLTHTHALCPSHRDYAI